MERHVQFGNINLITNGISLEIYKMFFDMDHVPLGAVSLSMIKELRSKMEKRQGSGSLPKNDDFPLTEEYVREQNAKAERQQILREKKLAYPESKGFFRDYVNASSYADNLVRGGLVEGGNCTASTLHTECEGESRIKRKRLEFRVVAVIKNLPVLNEEGELEEVNEINHHLFMYFPEGYSRLADFEKYLRGGRIPKGFERQLGRGYLRKGLRGIAEVIDGAQMEFDVKMNHLIQGGVGGLDEESTEEVTKMIGENVRRRKQVNLVAKRLGVYSPLPNNFENAKGLGIYGKAEKFESYCNRVADMMAIFD